MKKGFTLIELLAVIAVLAIIILIASSYIINIIEKSRESLYKNNEKMLSKAAETYLASNQNLIPVKENDITVIDLNDLVTNKFIDGLKDQNGNNCNGQVTVHMKNNNLEYNPYITCSSIYQSSVNYSNNNLVLFYNFKNAPSGSIISDLSTSNISGTITNGIYDSNKKSLIFNGSSYITLNNPLASQTPATQDWAVEAVVRVYSTLKGESDALLSSTFNNDLFLSYYSSNRLILYLNSGANDYYDYGNYDMSDDKIKHVIFNFKYSTDTIEIFVNGVDYSIDGPRTATRIPSGITGTIRIGNQLEGEIYSLRIYSKSLTTTEIQNNYNYEKTKFGI